MTHRAAKHRRVPANDNPLWPWRGVCAACGADMGPVRDSARCVACLTGERVATPAEDALWAMLLEERESSSTASEGNGGPRRLAALWRNFVYALTRPATRGMNLLCASPSSTRKASTVETKGAFTSSGN